jgi:Domain of unknown function (DUF397)
VADLEQVPLRWRKSVASGGGNCVEVAWGADGRVFIRDSKDPLGPVLSLTPSQWGEFLTCLRGEKYDFSI